jgi:hypothetical protein
MESTSLNTDHEPLEGTIRQGHRNHAPGRKRRPKRELIWRIRRAKELVDLSDGTLSEAEAALRAAGHLSAIKDAAQRPDQVAAAKLVAPSSVSPRIDNSTSPEVELAAVLGLQEAQDLAKQLDQCELRRGVKPSRGMVIAIFFRMAMAGVKPNVLARFKELSVSHPFARWAHGNPDTKPRLEAVYPSLRRMLGEHDPELAIEANVKMLRRLAATTDASGNPLHPNIGLRCIVDGCLIQADVEQRPPVSGADQEAMIRPGRDMVKFLRYTNSEGQTTRKIHGYKLMAIIDMASTLPIVAKLFPATVDEREAALELIEWLFQLWPECPIEVLVGDALYDGSKRLAEELVFGWAIHPVFCERSDYGQLLAHRTTMGTPKCRHGHMRLRGTEGFPDPKDRGPNGRINDVITIDPGARIRWECSKRLCDNVTTHPYDDARFYTFYPRQGDHNRVALRKAIEAQRNAVESVFNSIKQLGLTGAGADRARWAGDREVEWLLLTGLMSMTARRLAHETGGYAEKQREAIELGLTDVRNSDVELGSDAAEDKDETADIG